MMAEQKNEKLTITKKAEKIIKKYKLDINLLLCIHHINHTCTKKKYYDFIDNEGNELTYENIRKYYYYNKCLSCYLYDESKTADGWIDFKYIKGNMHSFKCPLNYFKWYEYINKNYIDYFNNNNNEKEHYITAFKTPCDDNIYIHTKENGETVITTILYEYLYK